MKAKQDKHVGPTGQYMIRSLYFDSYDDRALKEKLDGVRDRDKYRIRYYNLDTSLPKDLPSIVAGEKLQESFEMNSTHIVMLDSNLSRKDTKKFMKEVEKVDGIKKVLGLESFVGSAVPDELIPENLKEVVDDGEYKLIFILSEYKVATDEVNRQCDEINDILDKYDEKGMLI